MLPRSNDPRAPVECLALIAQARDYIGRQVARYDADYAGLFTSAPFCEAWTAIHAALLLGDVEATKAGCRLWWTVTIAWARQGATGEGSRL
jgi:hypothetical protein